MPSDPDPAAEELWEGILRDAEGAGLEPGSDSPGPLGAWFKEVSPVALEGSTLTVAAPNPFAKEYIETRFGELIESLLKERLAGGEASLSVVVLASR